MDAIIGFIQWPKLLLGEKNIKIYLCMQESNRNGACTLIVEVEACSFCRLKLNESKVRMKLNSL